MFYTTSEDEESESFSSDSGSKNSSIQREKAEKRKRAEAMKKRRGSTIFNKRHTIKEIDNDSCSHCSSDDEIPKPLANPLTYMKTLVMKKVKVDPKIEQINEYHEEGNSSQTDREKSDTKRTNEDGKFGTLYVTTPPEPTPEKKQHNPQKNDPTLRNYEPTPEKLKEKTAEKKKEITAEKKKEASSFGAFNMFKAIQEVKDIR